MLLESIILSSAVFLLPKSIDKSMKIDEQTQKKYAKAFERQSAAEQLVRSKRDLTDKSLIKIINRKKAILTTTMQDFLELYERIVKIDFQEGEGIAELVMDIQFPATLTQIHIMTQSVIMPLSEKEVRLNLIFRGLSGTFVEDSKRKLAMANAQVKMANITYSQAETVVVALDAIYERSNKIAELLAKMDLLFSRTLKESKEIIDKNGYKRSNYSIDERKTLMTCINFADAIKKVLDAPLLDSNGEIAKESTAALQLGNEYLQKIQQL